MATSHRFCFALMAMLVCLGAMLPPMASGQYQPVSYPAAAQYSNSQYNNPTPASIYPSSAFSPSPYASQTALAPASIVPPPGQTTTFSQQPQTFQLIAEVPRQPQLSAYQQESIAAPQPMAQPQVPSDDMYRRMVQQDTAPDLNKVLSGPAFAPPPQCASPVCSNDYHCDTDAWHSQVLPQGIIYQSYLAGTKEPRFATWFNQNSLRGDMWDVTLGARAGIWRYGNDDPNWPEGWQVDIEGAVFPRLDPQGVSTPLIGDDYRFGIPLTYGGDRWEFKMGYYHISSHLGDEYVLYVDPNARRINYVRDSLILGAGYFFTPAIRTYGEIGVGAVDGGAEPVEMQFGAEWVQARNTGARGGPFAAINTDLRQEVAYGGNVSVQFGWMWRQFARGPNVRIGAQYFYGKEDEYEFFHDTVSRFGWGIWYDF
jgi:hypothetical protein